MPGFHMLGPHLLTPWYEGRRRYRNASLRQVFRRHSYEAPQRKRRQRVRTSASALSMSTKDVHGLWITMWMSDQYHAVPQHLTHCPIGRQHNPCNSIEIRFFLQKLVWDKSAYPTRSRRFSAVERTEVCRLTGQARARLEGYH